MTAKEKYYFGRGRRKEASARVRLIPGSNQSVINDQVLTEIPKIISLPLVITGQQDKFSISAKVSGGGKVGQLKSIQLGVARALVVFDNGLKTTLRKSGLLTRDPREKERKKPGLKRARRAPQWQKR